MGKLRVFDRPPEGSIIAENLSGEIDYLDSFAVVIDNARGHSIDHLTALLFTSLPRWSHRLMRLRDALVRPLGLRTGLVPLQAELDPGRRYEPGERAVFFAVIARTPTEIVMAEDDRHLSFRASVAAQDREGHRQAVFLTTLVQYHNPMGRLYFAVVRPFHRLLMRRLLLNFAGLF